MSATLPSYLDADAFDSLSLGGTLFLRDALIGKNEPSVSKAGALAIAQYIYDKTAKPKAAGMISTYTGESYWSGLLANATGLTVYFMLTEYLGLVSKSEKLGQDALLPLPSADGKMGKKFIKSIIQASELLVERQVLLAATKMAGVNIPENQPQPAKPLSVQ